MTMGERQSGHSGLLVHDPQMHDQQKRWPHSVAVVWRRADRQSVHFASLSSSSSSPARRSSLRQWCTTQHEVSSEQ